jgi:hypothetical protein
MVLAVGRWATIASIMLMVEVPTMVAAVLAPVGLLHLVFGACSGLMTRLLVSATARFDATINEALARPAAPRPAEESADSALERRDMTGSPEPGAGRGRGMGNGEGGGGRGGGRGRNRPMTDDAISRQS